MFFDYIPHLGKLRPSIRLEVENETKKIKTSFICLIDSGSDGIVSFADLGKFDLQLDFRGASIITLGGVGLDKCPSCNCELPSLIAYRKPINIFINNKIGKLNLDVFWRLKEFNPLKEYPFLIGRTFFEKFNITFKEAERKFSLEKA